MQHALVALQ